MFWVGLILGLSASLLVLIIVWVTRTGDSSEDRIRSLFYYLDIQTITPAGIASTLSIRRSEVDKILERMENRSSIEAILLPPYKGSPKTTLHFRKVRT
jgi:hypothetical protein